MCSFRDDLWRPRRHRGRRLCFGMKQAAGSRQQWPSTSSTWSGKSHAKWAFEQHCLHLASDELSFRATGKSCHSWVSCRQQRPSTSSPSSDEVKPLAGVEAVAARDNLTFRLTESHATRGCRAGSSDSRRPFLPAMTAVDIEAVATRDDLTFIDAA